MIITQLVNERRLSNTLTFKVYRVQYEGSVLIYEALVQKLPRPSEKILWSQFQTLWLFVGNLILDILGV